MKLDKPITLIPAKYTDQNTNKIVEPPPIKLESLDIIYLDNPLTKQYYIAIMHLPNNIVLFFGDEYDKNPDITKDQAHKKLLEMSNGNLEKFLQDQFPKTLEDDPFGPGTILASMFSAIGIKSSPTCSCRRHALEMNKNGIEWCEENIDTICSWLKEECEKRRIPYVETIAKMVVNKAINKARKYRNELNNDK